MKPEFRLKNTLAPNSAVNPADVVLVKELLAQKGDYKTPDYGLTPYPDRRLFEAIKSFQRVNDLKVDGVMKPGGPTEQKLALSSPIYRCSQCGAPHGGAFGSLCWDCHLKL